MSYIPDASKYEGDMQTHSEKHYEELALRRRAGRFCTTRSRSTIRIRSASAASLHGSKAAPSAASACSVRARRSKSSFAFTFKDWNLWDDMPAWRECTTGPIEDRLMKLSDPRAPAGAAQGRADRTDHQQRSTTSSCSSASGPT